MSTPTKLARLKRQLSAHRQAMDALNTATRRLHQTLGAIIVTAEGRQRSTPVKARASTAARPKGSGGAASPPANNGTAASETRTHGRRRRLAPASRQEDLDRALAAALERHWGNLF